MGICCRECSWLGVCRMLHSSTWRTPSQLHSLQQIPTQHNTLPQHLVYKNELNGEYVITLARNDETPWWWSEKIETCRSGFKWKLYRCICWLIVEVILQNAQCNYEIQTNLQFTKVAHLDNFAAPSVAAVSAGLIGRGFSCRHVATGLVTTWASMLQEHAYLCGADNTQLLSTGRALNTNPVKCAHT